MSVATIITPPSAQLLSQKEQISGCLEQAISTAKHLGSRTFLVPTTSAGHWVAQTIVRDPALQLVLYIVYYYEKMLWEHSEDVGAWELCNAANKVIELDFEETDDLRSLYRLLVDRAAGVIVLDDGSAAIADGLDYARQKHKQIIQV